MTFLQAVLYVLAIVGSAPLLLLSWIAANKVADGIEKLFPPTF